MKHVKSKGRSQLGFKQTDRPINVKVSCTEQVVWSPSEMWVKNCVFWPEESRHPQAFNAGFAHQKDLTPGLILRLASLIRIRLSVTQTCIYVGEAASLSIQQQWQTILSSHELSMCTQGHDSRR